MSPSVRRRLDALRERREELGLLLADPGAMGDPTRYAAQSREYAQLAPVVADLADYEHTERALAATRALAGEADPELRELAQSEARALTERLETIEARLLRALLPRDPQDGADVFLEVRAGTGGDEAALFAGDLWRMYARYAEARGWSTELLDASPGEHGGYKKLVARIAGGEVYARLKFEAGAHRVQRVPATESQGRIHTSACTVAVLPEVEDEREVELDPSQLRIDTYRASGAGGQHVNKTESAIRITHLPTGLVVECQDERSQHKNRARAMSLLRARLADAQRAQQQAATDQSRRLQVGSGDRSERIRTYNFPQGRVTDHRINLTVHALEDVLAGGLDAVIEPLLREEHADRLKRMGDAA